MEITTEISTEISTEIRENLKKLSKVNLDFLEFVKKNPESLKSSSYKALEANRYEYNLQSWPTFINRETKKLFTDMAVKIFRLITGIPSRIFANDAKRIADYFEQPESVIKLQLEGVTEEHLANMVGRIDFTYSTKELKCLEYNITVGTSGWQIPEWENLYLKIPVIHRFFRENRIKINNRDYPELFLEHIIRYAAGLTASRENEGKPELNVVMAMRGTVEDHQNSDPLLKYLKHIYREKVTRNNFKGNIYMCDFPHLECKDDMVFYKGNRIHGIIELFHGFLTPGVMKAYTSGNIRLINGPITGLLFNKLNLALLSEHEDSQIFDEEERETIKKYIPWTRKIVPGEILYQGEKVQMENFLLENKDRLVIKPSLGLGGGDVCIGQGTFRKKWEHSVKMALQKKNYLVQELVESPRSLYQVGEEGGRLHDTVWGVWVLGSRYGASFVRAVPAGNTRKVVNGAQGAKISLVFEVDE